MEQNEERALYWYRRSAEGGNGVAMCNLGWCYKRGYGVEQNWQEAVKWYEQGAQCGNLQSMHSLAYCYERGEGVKQKYDGSDPLVYCCRRGRKC